MALPAVRGAERKDLALRGALEHLAPGPWLERPDTPDGVITAVRRLAPVEARYAPFPDRLDPRLRAALERRGLTQLYSHQAEALTRVAAGGTSSSRRRPPRARRSATTCRCSTRS